VTASLLFKMVNDPTNTVNIVSDSVTIQFIDTPFDLIMSDIPFRVNQASSDLIFDSSLSTMQVNYPINLRDMGIQYILICPSYLFYSNSDLTKYCSPN
jgi:hypothetical protein